MKGPVLSQSATKSEDNVPATCPSHPFNEPLGEAALKELSHKNFSSETLKKVLWVWKMYCEWRQHRHSLGLEYITCDLEDHSTISTGSLSFALCRFLTEVKKVDGSDFPGKMLYDILVCVQFHLECLGFAFCLINDTTFHDLKFTLDNLMK